MHSKKISAVAIAAIVFALAACSTPADTGTDTGAKADVAAAEAGIKPFTDSPSEFPVTEPLITKPTGKKIAILDCGSPICALFADLAAAPAEALGMTATRIEAGTSADGVAAAFDTVLSGGFDGVFVPAIAPSLWERPLADLNAAGIPVVTSGVVGLPKGAVGAAGASEISSSSSGKLAADWAVVQDGDATDVVFYTTPELSFSAIINEAFLAEMDALCPDCAVRTVEIPVTQFGSGGPQIIVDDLLAHPDTTSAVFAVGEQSIGLPPALKTADITNVKILANSPDPSVLASIQDGTYTAGIGVDLAVLTWTSIDSLARLVTGQDADPGAVNDLLVRQLLTSENLKGDVSHGWSGYPDFADRFMALWADAK
jgi:ribose transport system substrate-binding protein